MMSSKINGKMVTGLAVLFVIASLRAVIVHATDFYSPYVTQSYPKNVYFGDMHLHTRLSVDANREGNSLLTPKDAYRFARGETVVAHNGEKVRLQKPLDFIVIADHAENMGVMAYLRVAAPVLLGTKMGKQLYAELKNLQGAPDTSKSSIVELGASLWRKEREVKNLDFRSFVWDTVAHTADYFNKPGKFTTFIGYEWSSADNTRPPVMLHRVVVFKDDSEKVAKIVPFTSFDGNQPEELWAYMATYENNTDGEVLAIPHNSNISSGMMFAPYTMTGDPFNRDYAKTRNRWEPLLEVTQIKGDSETHPELSATDEFADYERWRIERNADTPLTEQQRRKMTYEYARSALKLGLKLDAKLGVNPFKIGLIGSTDAHTSLSTAKENNFFGKMSHSEPHAQRMLESMTTLSPGIPQWKVSASGRAAVWATENTREALFAAMKRKEVYATTGPRMTVRFFGGWEYDKNDALKPDLAKIGYSKGVPMGGDLTHAPKGKTPQFLIRATKDPDGANLDRVQIIKGWHDKRGKLHERIYNVALSDDRKENKSGIAPPVGSTVNVKDASYINSIGDPELAVVWTDPDFNKDELAFYYVRVLEIPTPRWTAYDAKHFGVKEIPDEIPMITQERAYTSPIWYSPK